MSNGVATFEQPRLDLSAYAERAWKAMLRFDSSVELDPALNELVRLRASMLNGCAYCVDMHTKDARAKGESEQRLYAVAAWGEAPFFSERERAALALTDSVTLISETKVPREVWDAAAEQFDPEEISQLLYAITVINAWNRLAVATRMLPGEYEPEAA